MNYKMKRIFVLSVVFIIGLTLGLGISQQLNIKNKSTFDTVLENILNYASTDKDINKTDLESTAINAMLKILDDEYSIYLDADKYSKLKENLSGKYSGLGIRTMPKVKGEPFILDRVYKGTDAYKKGLVEGDFINKINGVDISEVGSFNEVRDLIHKNADIRVELSVFRPSTNESKEYIISGEKVEIKVVDGVMLSDDTGYISLLQVSSNIDKKFKTILKRLKSEGMKKLILDLRGNEGGEVNTAALIEGMFLDEKVKTICRYKNKRNGEEVGIINVEEQVFSGELIILVDNNTASACEMIAGSLSDLGRAKIIGEQTYGKGSMQTIIEDKNNNSALKLTISNYVSAAGSYIDGIGIKPDIVVEQSPFLSSLGYINEDPNRSKIRLNNMKVILSEKYGENKAIKMSQNGDLQLKRAIEELSK